MIKTMTKLKQNAKSDRAYGNTKKPFKIKKIKKLDLKRGHSFTNSQKYVGNTP